MSLSKIVFSQEFIMFGSEQKGEGHLSCEGELEPSHRLALMSLQYSRKVCTVTNHISIHTLIGRRHFATYVSPSRNACPSCLQLWVLDLQSSS